jgi:hypothetical protein
MKLQFNEAPLDRTVRIVLGIALLALVAVGGLTAPAMYLVWLVAAIALVTGAVGFCPLYAIFRFSTRAAHR